MNSDNSTLQLITAVLLALLPVLIWMQSMFQKEASERLTLFKAFLFGTFSVVPLAGIQYLWALHPEYDVYSLAANSFDNVKLSFVATFIAIGIFEEVAKFNMLTHLKWAKVKITSINDAMRYIFIIALGFAFAENILYFYRASAGGNLSEIFAVFVYRSTFTTAAHMVFSGIVGYYYAIGKFGNPALELDRWTGKKHPIVNGVKKLFKNQGDTVFHFGQTMKGLFIAMVLHAGFNYALEMQQMTYAAGIVVFGFAMVIYLSKKRMTYLVFTEEEKARPSTIGKQEEDVVIELMGMWLNEGKYKEVIEICDRLSKRDPDNNVVKLFRAKAVDKKKIERVSRAINLLFTEEDYDVEQEEMSLFERLKKNKAHEAHASSIDPEDMKSDELQKALQQKASHEIRKEKAQDARILLADAEEGDEPETEKDTTEIEEDLSMSKE
jgi:RsiW-degrading membrane proteinase PrsW (M82 family)